MKCKKTAVFAILFFLLLIPFAVARHFFFTYNIEVHYSSLGIYRMALERNFVWELVLAAMSVFSILAVRYMCKNQKESIPLQLLQGLISFPALYSMCSAFCHGIAIVGVAFSQESLGIEYHEIPIDYDRMDVLVVLMLLMALACLSLVRNILGVKLLKNDPIWRIIDYPAVFLLFLASAANIVFAIFCVIVLKRDLTMVEQILTYVSNSLLTAGIGMTILLRNSLEKREDGLIQVFSSGKILYYIRQLVLEPDESEETDEEEEVEE